MAHAVRRSYNALALLAMLLLAVVPTLGRLHAGTAHAASGHAHVAHHGGHDTSGQMPAHHDSAACAYCAILGGADVPGATVVALTKLDDLSGCMTYRTPAQASRAWTLGSRGPPRRIGA